MDPARGNSILDPAHIWVNFWRMYVIQQTMILVVSVLSDWTFVYNSLCTYCFLASNWGNFGWRLLSLCVTMGESHFTFIISYFLVLIVSCLDLFLTGPLSQLHFHSTVLTVFRWQFLSRMFWCRIGTFWLIFSQPFNTFVIFHQFTIKKQFLMISKYILINY